MKAAKQRCDSGFENDKEVDLKIGVQAMEDIMLGVRQTCKMVVLSFAAVLIVLWRTRCVRPEENDLRAGLWNLQAAGRPHLSVDPRDDGQAAPRRRLHEAIRVQSQEVRQVLNGLGWKA